MTRCQHTAQSVVRLGLDLSHKICENNILVMKTTFGSSPLKQVRTTPNIGHKLIENQCNGITNRPLHKVKDDLVPLMPPFVQFPYYKSGVWGSKIKLRDYKLKFGY